MTNHLSNLVRDNFIHKASYLARRTNGMSVQATPDYIRVDCGLPSDTFNVVVILKSDLQDSDITILQETVHYFRDKNTPMALWSWEDSHCVTFQTLRKIGLEIAETNVAMVANLDNLHPDTMPPANFRILEVSTPVEIQQFGHTLASLFGESQEAGNVRAYYKLVTESLLQPDSALKLYIGYIGSEVVSTGSIMVTDESVGIYDIATKQEYRGKGFGSAMFNFLITEAQRHKPKFCVLQASSDGINIYLRSGFEPVCEVTVFENK
ncbi:GNAT family N-acetyltransferase [Paenibacillus sp. KN14-4R]|uniref:GNAT family N-acetyltransferase n=1 Tax=Paenibacillus sp. KN14-4R TaxID=3445773 RepID=UPI003F9EBBF0